MITDNEKEIMRSIIKSCKKFNIPRSTTFEFLKWYLFIDYTCNNIDSFIMRFHKLSSIDFSIFNTDLLRTIAVHVSQFFINSYIIANAMESIVKMGEPISTKQVINTYHEFIDKINHNQKIPIIAIIHNKPTNQRTYIVLNNISDDCDSIENLDLSNDALSFTINFIKDHYNDIQSKIDKIIYKEENDFVGNNDLNNPNIPRVISL